MAKMMKKTKPHAELDHPILAEDDQIIYLYFDSPWAQGAMFKADPVRPVFEYIQQMCAFLLFTELSKHTPIAILGLGAGSLYRFFKKMSAAPITAVEWHDMVIQCAKDHFKVKETKRCQVVQADANLWVRQKEQVKAYSIVLVDLYDYTAEGPVCSSKGFYRGCASILSKPGIMVVNLFGHHPSYQKNLENIKLAFNDRVMIFPETKDGNRVVLAFKGPARVFSLEQLEARARRVQRDYGLPAVAFLKALVEDDEGVNAHLVDGSWVRI